jgi:hypothetical protein
MSAVPQQTKKSDFVCLRHARHLKIEDGELLRAIMPEK